MRAVLYSSIDLEPITVLRLEPFAVKNLVENNRVTLPVFESINVAPYASTSPKEVNFTTVEIVAEHLLMYGKKTMILFTADEESALLLKSVFLAGQQKELKNIRAETYHGGMLNALNRFGFYRD